MRKKYCLLFVAAILSALCIGNGRAVIPSVNATEKKNQALVGAETFSPRDSQSRWELILVNRSNPIPDNYQVSLTDLDNHQQVDSRIYPALQAMFDAARADGVYPAISSSYRTYEDQCRELEEKTEEYRQMGYSEEDASQMALEWVALPGTSEHELGLAVDITTADWENQDASIVWSWLDDNSYRFGFIKRYPGNKTDITGIAHEEWHYRYVGTQAAKEIHAQGICLEEYLDTLS